MDRDHAPIRLDWPFASLCGRSERLPPDTLTPVVAWLRRSLAARYVVPAAETLPRELLDLLPND